MEIVVILLVFMFLVFIHELGHFLAAKSFGVGVIEFSIGFSMFGLFKPLFIKSYKETKYKIYPTVFLGGYVKVKGQDDNDFTYKEYSKDSYTTLHPMKKIVFLLAGVVANALLAWFIFLGIAMNNPKVLSPIIGEIAKGSPAYQASLKSGDRILSINNNPIKEWQDISEIISKSDSSIVFKVARNNETLVIDVLPKEMFVKNIFGEDVKKKVVGIAPKGVSEEVALGFSESFIYATNKTVDFSFLILQGIQKLIVGVVPTSEIGGVVSIGKVISDAYSMGITEVFMIMAIISINLAVLNLLPIPLLDGGHVVFVMYEAIFKKEISNRVLNALYAFGITLLGILFAIGIYNDINRFF